MYTRCHRSISLTSSTLSPDFAGRWIFSTLLVFFSLVLTPPLMWGDMRQEPLAGLVINEIMKDPVSVSDSRGEYIELYNPNSSGIRINEWVIKDLGNDFHVIESSEPLVVEPFSFFVLARDSSFEMNGGFYADYQYSSFTLSNGSDEVILLDSNGNAIDSLEYESVGFPSIAGSSMELRNQEFNNVHGYNWDEAVTSYGAGDFGTPGSQNSVWEVYKEVTLDVEVDSIITPVGESVQFGFSLTAQSQEPVFVILFADLWLPDGNPFPNNPLFGPIAISLEIEERWEKILRIDIPLGAEIGEYLLVGHLQDEDGNEIDKEEVLIRVVYNQRTFSRKCLTSMTRSLHRMI